MKRVSSALTLALALTALLVAGCTSSKSPSAHPSPSPTDAFSALTPPSTDAVGSFNSATAQRAYDATQGMLAQQLLEPGTLKGTDRAGLVSLLEVPNPALSVTRYIGVPTRKGLDIRPLFAKNVILDNPPAEILSSKYSADEVRGQLGEKGLRITWDGAVRYHVLVAGEPRSMDYALRISYVFGSAGTADPTGITLQQVVPGTIHTTPVVTACLTKGLLLPAPDGGITTGACPA